MTHPLILPILDLAIPIAAELGLDIVDVAFQTNKRPPILRIDIRNLQQDTSLDDCEKMSRPLEPHLDSTPVIPENYVLEVSSPGISRQLSQRSRFYRLQRIWCTRNQYRTLRRKSTMARKIAGTG